MLRHANSGRSNPPKSTTASDSWWDGTAPVPSSPISQPSTSSQKPLKTSQNSTGTSNFPTGMKIMKQKPQSSPWSLPSVQQLSLDDRNYPDLSQAIHTQIPKTPIIPSPVKFPATPITALPSVHQITPPRSSNKHNEKTMVNLGELLEKSPPKKKQKKKLEEKKEPLSKGLDSSAFPAPAVNLLGTTVPKKVRGKEREQPKKPKKPSAMKQAVLASRELRKEVVNQPKDELNAPEEVLEGNSELPSAALPSTQPPAKSTASKPIPISPYCHQLITPEIDKLVEQFLDTLCFYQDRSYHQQDPTKFKRRFICGLKDVMKKINLNEIRLIVIASNVESTQQPGGPDELLGKILNMATERKLPVIFALKRWTLGRHCRKPSPVSIVGVMNYDVASADVKEVLRLTEQARLDYENGKRYLPENTCSGVKESAVSGEDVEIRDEQVAAEFSGED